MTIALGRGPNSRLCTGYMLEFSDGISVVVCRHITVAGRPHLLWTDCGSAASVVC